MNKDPKERLRSFTKGKIAELIFERMVKNDEEHDYIVIPFGYEYSMPELAKYRDCIESKQTRLTLSRSPDFVLISNNSEKPKVYFIEVKYRKLLNEVKILKEAKRVYRYWPDAYLFLFTQEKIYFDKCKTIKENLGKMEELGDTIFSKDYQNMTLEVLREFIR